jgi:hypothetical protein
VPQRPCSVAPQVAPYPRSATAAHSGEDGAPNGGAREEAGREAGGPSAAIDSDVEGTRVEIHRDAEHAARSEPAGGDRLAPLAPAAGGSSGAWVAEGVAGRAGHAIRGFGFKFFGGTA